MAKASNKSAVLKEAVNVEPTMVAPAHFSINEVKEALLEVEGVSFKEPRSNGNICGKIKGKTFYLDLPDRSSTKEQGITVRFGFEPKGFELKTYRTNTVSGVWPACKGELDARNKEEVDFLKTILANGI